MSLTLYMTKGLPGSGKTTWAKEQLTTNHNGWGTRVNKDELRAMMHLSRFGRTNEKIVLSARDSIVAAALSRGQHVICDDTNLEPKHEEQLRTIARGAGATLLVIDFTDVPLDVCMERNRTRTDKPPVPEATIRQMYRKHVAPKVTPTYDTTLPAAVLVDLDGTLAHMNGRGPFDWDKVGTDTPDIKVLSFLDLIANARGTIILLSGRDGVCRPETEAWLAEHDVPYTELYMRAEGDNRKDSIVKRELFEQHVVPHYYPWLVLDDRDQVVRMWRDELGLTVWQVADGDF